MSRTVLSLPSRLHHRVQRIAVSRGISMAQVIREALEKESPNGNVARLGEPAPIYVADPVPYEEDDTMKRIVITLPEDMHDRLRSIGTTSGLSMAAYVRSVLEQRVRSERPKPRFGAFDSGFADTASLAGEIQMEPRTWRSS